MERSRKPLLHFYFNSSQNKLMAKSVDFRIRFRSTSALQKMAYLTYHFFVLFLVKISKNSYIKILLLDEQNDLRFLVLFPVREKLK